MINLLPPADKQIIVAGRTNSLLIRYNLLLLGAVVFLLGCIGVTYAYLNYVKSTAEQTIQENQSKVSSYASIQAEAAQFRTNLATAKQILDREVAYTNVILAFARALPSGVIIDSLDLDVQTFGTETTLTAKAKSYEGAIALKDTFEQSPLFSNVHFQSISAADSESDYPYTVNLNVTISKDAAK